MDCFYEFSVDGGTVRVPALFNGLELKDTDKLRSLIDDYQASHTDISRFALRDYLIKNSAIGTDYVGDCIDALDDKISIDNFVSGVNEYINTTGRVKEAFKAVVFNNGNAEFRKEGKKKWNKIEAEDIPPLFDNDGINANINGNGVIASKTLYTVYNEAVLSDQRNKTQLSYYLSSLPDTTTFIEYKGNTIVTGGKKPVIYYNPHNALSLYESLFKISGHDIADKSMFVKGYNDTVDNANKTLGTHYKHLDINKEIFLNDGLSVPAQIDELFSMDPSTKNKILNIFLDNTKDSKNITDYIKFVNKEPSQIANENEIAEKSFKAKIQQEKNTFKRNAKYLWPQNYYIPELTDKNEAYNLIKQNKGSKAIVIKDNNKMIIPTHIEQYDNGNIYVRGFYKDSGINLFEKVYKGDIEIMKNKHDFNSDTILGSRDRMNISFLTDQEKVSLLYDNNIPRQSVIWFNGHESLSNGTHDVNGETRVILSDKTLQEPLIQDVNYISTNIDGTLGDHVGLEKNDTAFFLYDGKWQLGKVIGENIKDGKEQIDMFVNHEIVSTSRDIANGRFDEKTMIPILRTSELINKDDNGVNVNYKWSKYSSYNVGKSGADAYIPNDGDITALNGTVYKYTQGKFIMFNKGVASIVDNPKIERWMTDRDISESPDNMSFDIYNTIVSAGKIEGNKEERKYFVPSSYVSNDTDLLPSGQLRVGRMVFTDAKPYNNERDFTKDLVKMHLRQRGEEYNGQKLLITNNNNLYVHFMDTYTPVSSVPEDMKGTMVIVNHNPYHIKDVDAYGRMSGELNTYNIMGDPITINKTINMSDIDTKTVNGNKVPIIYSKLDNTKIHTEVQRDKKQLILNIAHSFGSVYDIPIEYKNDIKDPHVKAYIDTSEGDNKIVINTNVINSENELLHEYMHLFLTASKYTDADNYEKLMTDFAKLNNKTSENKINMNDMGDVEELFVKAVNNDIWKNSGFIHTLSGSDNFIKDFTNIINNVLNTLYDKQGMKYTRLKDYSEGTLMQLLDKDMYDIFKMNGDEMHANVLYFDANFRDWLKDNVTIKCK